ncbi:hypothetical protein KEM54_003952 [Ascosphaera aggregata]|nr:hypothetical protein KEM54_003952 [Ascosphaera aggregata]
MLKYLVKPPQKKRKLDETLDVHPTPPTPGLKLLNSRGVSPVPGNSYSEGTTLGPTEPFIESQSELDLALPEIQDDSQAARRDSPEETAAKEREESQRLSPRERIERRYWIHGTSSVYVDAFNLTLDDVLESEKYLFDEPELALFEQWRSLSYEAQYLYVRLFLRKTAAWHRVSHLAYQHDITNLSGAIRELREIRSLPGQSAQSCHSFLDSGNAPVLGEAYQFAEGIENLTSVEEASSLLVLPELKVLAKEERVTGKNKCELVKALGSRGLNQGALNFNARRGSETPEHSATANSQNNRSMYLISKILERTGDCIRLYEPVFRLFERVHLIFYRSTEWTEKSLSTIILAKTSRRNFPAYTVSRSHRIFNERDGVLEFEGAMRVQHEVDNLLEFNKEAPEQKYGKVREISDAVYPRWRALLAEEQTADPDFSSSGEKVYLRRFSPAWVYTRIIQKGLLAYARFKDHKREYDILCELLEQKLYHPARRGAWYQRKALLEEHYAWEIFPCEGRSVEEQKKLWKRSALRTAELGLQDPQTHVIYHYDLQKRILKLERALRVVKREQHDFGHVMLAKAVERTVKGIQIKSASPIGIATSPQRKGKPTVWIDEKEDCQCRVETMCLRWYEQQGWKGFHTEGGIIRTLFAYLFYDILFASVPNVFQTEYQTCPLDLHTDSFYPSRMSEINRRLVEISNGGATEFIKAVHHAEYDRKTCIVGLDWTYELEDLREIAECFNGEALAIICKVLAQDYQQRGGGMPDLFLWNPKERRVMFAEVKSENDRLSDTQRLWVHILTGSGVAVELCHAVAKEIKTEKQGRAGYEWSSYTGK